VSPIFYTAQIEKTMNHKTIISGRLEFGNQRTFDKVLNMYVQRVENYFKGDIVFKLEEIMDEGSFSISIPRFIGQSGEKTWLNTVNLLEYITEFSVAGAIDLWMVEQGKILKHKHIEPKSDKIAVQSYLKGRALASKPGMEDKARDAFNAAIEKYAKHALAYERRGYVNYKLGNMEDALYDFNKSITLHPANPDPHVGAAIVKFTQNHYEEAMPYLDNAIKNSIPHQPVYWQARRLKAEAYNALNQFDLAVKELKLFTSRNFEKSNPNFEYLAKAYFDYGKALLHLGNYLDAIDMFDKAILFIKNNNQIPVPEILPFKTKAMEKAGKNSTLEDSVVK